jgi:hypothetical protein
MLTSLARVAFESVCQNPRMGREQPELRVFCFAAGSAPSAIQMGVMYLVSRHVETTANIVCLSDLIRVISIMQRRSRQIISKAFRPDSIVLPFSFRASNNQENVLLWLAFAAPRTNHTRSESRQSLLFDRPVTISSAESAFAHIR